MPRLTFACTTSGLTLPVVVGLDGQAIVNLMNSGTPVPPPMVLNGLIDTGTDVTSVAGTVLRALGLTSLRSSSTQTAGGQVPVGLYKASLTISDPQDPSGPAIVEDQLTVMELPHNLPDIDVLIGLDILWKCRLLFDGPARQFTLEF